VNHGASRPDIAKHIDATPASATAGDGVGLGMRSIPARQFSRSAFDQIGQLPQMRPRSEGATLAQQRS